MASEPSLIHPFPSSCDKWKWSLLTQWATKTTQARGMLNGRGDWTNMRSLYRKTQVKPLSRVFPLTQVGRDHSGHLTSSHHLWSSVCGLSDFSFMLLFTEQGGMLLLWSISRASFHVVGKQCFCSAAYSGKTLHAFTLPWGGGREAHLDAEGEVCRRSV